MFERYPAESRRLLFLAREIARSIAEAAIQPEHLLAAALEMWPPAIPIREPLLRALAIAPVDREPVTADQVQFSAGAKRVLTTAMVRADQLGHHRIRPEHLLIALLEEPGLESPLRDAGILRHPLIESATRAARADDSPCVDPNQATSDVPDGHVPSFRRRRRRR